MDSQQWSFFQQYLLFPSLVALLTAVFSVIASYKATYRLNQNNKESERKTKLSDLIDKMLLEVNRLIPLFEKLRTDFDKDNFFSFRNIELISNARWRLVGLQNEIILFDDDFRKIILEDIDTVSTLVDELNALENNPFQGFTDLKNKLNETVKEDRSFRLELLKMGIYLQADDQGNLRPKYIGQKALKNKTLDLDDKLSVIDVMRKNLISGVEEAQKQLDDTNTDTTRRRDRLVARVIDAQNKLKSLQDSLNNMVV